MRTHRHQAEDAAHGIEDDIHRRRQHPLQIALGPISEEEGRRCDELPRIEKQRRD